MNAGEDETLLFPRLHSDAPVSVRHRPRLLSSWGTPVPGVPDADEIEPGPLGTITPGSIIVAVATRSKPVPGSGTDLAAPRGQTMHLIDAIGALAPWP